MTVHDAFQEIDGKQQWEGNKVALFEAKLLKDHRGKLTTYGETMTIDNESTPAAIERAKNWAKKQELFDDTWLQVTSNGVECAMMRPGEF